MSKVIIFTNVLSKTTSSLHQQAHIQEFVKGGHSSQNFLQVLSKSISISFTFNAQLWTGACFLFIPMNISGGNTHAHDTTLIWCYIMSNLHYLE